MPGWEPFAMSGVWTTAPAVNDPANIVASARAYEKVQVFTHTNRAQVLLRVVQGPVTQTLSATCAKVNVIGGISP